MKTTIGLISANYTNEKFGTLAAKRTLASLPYGGRYRLIDFPLSNMINSGISTVGLITPYNYRSLMDHVGVGKAWSLGRKVGGMFILPGSVYGVRSSASKFLQRDIIQNRRYIDRDTADYVLFCGSNKVFNMDFRPLIEQHERNAYPITLAYKKVEHGENCDGFFLNVDDSGKVAGIRYNAEGEANYFLDCFVIDREFLISFINWFDALSYMDVMEIVMDSLNDIGVDAYEFQGYVGAVNNLDDYMRVNMDLLKPEIRTELFNSERKIFTKVQDEPPVLYRPTANVKNSIISAGCIVEGEVENSIIFRSSHIKPGAVVKNCIIMQHGMICEDAYAANMICDKYVTIGRGARIEGGADHPFVIGKNQEL